MIEKHYTLLELVEDILIGINPTELSRKCSKGMIPGAVKLGRQWLIPESTIKEMLHITSPKG